MEFPLTGIMVAAAVTDSRTLRGTGEVIPEKGEIYMLVRERGKPTVKTITCSIGAATKLEPESLEIGAEIAEKTLVVDMSEWKLDNGKSGISIKLVENIK